MPHTNVNLTRAFAARDDEFYTRREYIEREVATYPGAFTGATVHCPCDDPDRSMFFAHFRDRFHDLGLKRLIATGLSVADGSPVGRVFDGVRETDLDLQSGSFASPEVRAIMGRTPDTVVITNPPFSMMRTFIVMLAESGVRFCVMGPLHTLSYRKVLPFVTRGEVWIGGTTPTRCIFDHADGTEKRFGNIRFFTNMTHTRRHRIFPLTRSYDPESYPAYTNAVGINVDRATDIPGDFAGTMGVPISFLEKLNPAQFDIVGFKRTPCVKTPDGGSRNVFNRLLIRNRQPAGRVTVGASTAML